jgi:hypothetical protein
MHTCLPQVAGHLASGVLEAAVLGLQLLHAALVALGVLAKVFDGVFVSIMLELREGPQAGPCYSASLARGRSICLRRREFITLLGGAADNAARG